MGMTPQDFVAAMKRAVAGVSVVTTDGVAGRFGITVSAFSSVSAEPPMVLACVNRRSPVCAAIRANGVFSVNLLAAQHAPVADMFAGRPREGAAFDFGAHRWRVAGANACPLLEDALAAFHCRLHAATDAGSHTVFIGAVLDTLASSHVPLAYTAQRYARPEFLEL